MSIPMTLTRRALGALCAALIMLILAGCGATPQAPGVAPTAGAGAPTAYPPPTAYPAPQGGADPTAYPAPLGEGAATEPARTTTPAATRPPAATEAPAPTRPPMQATVRPQPTAGQGGASGEVPQAKIDLAVADLAQRAGVDRAAVSVVSAEAVEWPDGSLGCPQPGMAYLQVITPGYRLVLAASGQEYNYHAAAEGEFFLCENRMP